MRRRDLIAMLIGAAVAWPLAARAQQATLPVIGWLNALSSTSQTDNLTAFRRGLEEASFVEVRNVMIEYRWADGRPERLPTMAADLVERKALVIAAGGGPPAIIAAKEATATIPIVSIFGGDPVKNRFVDSFNRPGHNITGFHVASWGLESKRLELLHDMMPDVRLVAALISANNPDHEAQANDLQTAARVLGLDLMVLTVGTGADFDRAFATLVEQKAGALSVAGDPIFTNARGRLIELAARYRVPAIHEWRDDAKAGGLMSYGDSLTAGFRQLGIYAGRILKGAKPTELPVVQSTKFEFVINLKTAKALGLTIPPTLLARADEVIE